MSTTDLPELERRLWSAADQLRANSSLTPAEYRSPVLGLIFLAFAEHRFDELRPELELKATERRQVSVEDFRARGVLYVPDIARLSWLVELPEGEDLGANVDLAMDAIETTNDGLRGVLPRGYQKLEKSVLLELVRLFAPLPRMLTGDAFGLIYEYFLSEFAATGRVVAHNGAEICRLDVARSSRPIWAKTGKGPRVLYVRLNNSSRAMPTTSLTPTWPTAGPN